ncbi:aminopeptidase P family N-terminal domain-containing protein, partial [Thermocatellispora tengchongensis]|uniref:aminopeptidase P family N-terminal domain-containing protein n=1 Tax=Thermocatellispora tengchongensis TaxID=1073253 RepID=UPI0031E50177
MNPVSAHATTDYPTLSLAERDRRWAAVRQLLADHSLDAIVVFGLGRDATDAYLTNEAKKAIVVMTRTEDPVMLLGDVPLERYDAPGQRWERWADQWRHGDQLAMLADLLKERGLDRGTVGIVGLTGRFVGEARGTISYTTWQEVLRSLPKVNWVDVAAAYKVLALVKSPEEQVLLRKAAS